MSSLRVRSLFVKISTDKGLFGTRINFEDGLNVLRAENTSGKSTCVQAIFYALGLEGAFSARREPPLPHALLTHLEYGDKKIAKVLQSEVFLEVENGSKRTITVRRAVAGFPSTNLVTAWDGWPLSKLNVAPASAKRDFFVRVQHSATHEDGFHHFLAQFLGWRLPTVTKFNGDEVPLYMEVLLPLMVIEQKHGWTSTQARLPTYLGIKNAYKRAVEFYLDLESHKLALLRQQLKQEADDITLRWKAIITEAQSFVRPRGVLLSNLPGSPITSWPPDPEPLLGVPIDETVLMFGSYLKELRKNLKQLQSLPISNVEERSDDLQEQLRIKQDKLRLTDAKIVSIRALLERESYSISEIDKRISHLKVELTKNKDAAKLQSYGGISQLAVTQGVCPTCAQEINDALLRSDQALLEPMPISENIEYLKQQLTMFEGVRNRTIQNAEQLKVRSVAEVKVATDLQAQIRSIKDSLLSPSSSPSSHEIAERLRLERRIEELEMLDEEVEKLMVKLEELSEEWRENRAEVSELPKGDLSTTDKNKLEFYSSAFRANAKRFGLRSVDPENLSISPDTFRPEYDGFEFEGIDLENDASASDLIRTIWAQVSALAEYARTKNSNHLGLVVFDEPRQHDAAVEDFEVFLRHLSEYQSHGQQAIVATSEDKERISKLAQGARFKVHSFDGYVIDKLL